MSININDIYCKQWLKNKKLENMCIKKEYKFFYIEPHYVMHIKDSINYKALKTNDYQNYKEYITTTDQTEHSIKNYLSLQDNFDIDKMEKINIEYNSKIKNI